MYKHLSSDVRVPEDCFFAMTIRASSAAKSAAAKASAAANASERKPGAI